MFHTNLVCVSYKCNWHKANYIAHINDHISFFERSSVYVHVCRYVSGYAYMCVEARNQPWVLNAVLQWFLRQGLWFLLGTLIGVGSMASESPRQVYRFASIIPVFQDPANTCSFFMCVLESKLRVCCMSPKCYTDYDPPRLSLNFDEWWMNPQTWNQHLWGWPQAYFRLRCHALLMTLHYLLSQVTMDSSNLWLDVVLFFSSWRSLKKCSAQHWCSLFISLFKHLLPLFQKQFSGGQGKKGKKQCSV